MEKTRNEIINQINSLRGMRNMPPRKNELFSRNRMDNRALMIARRDYNKKIDARMMGLKKELTKVEDYILNRRKAEARISRRRNYQMNNFPEEFSVAPKINLGRFNEKAPRIRIRMRGISGRRIK